MTEQYRLRTRSRLLRKQRSSNSSLMIYKSSLLTIAPQRDAKLCTNLSLDTKPKVQSTLLESNSFTNGLGNTHRRDGRSSRSQTCKSIVLSSINLGSVPKLANTNKDPTPIRMFFKYC